MPGLEEELEEHYAGILQGLGYRAALPPEGLVREVFIHALCALMLGPVYERAVESGAEGVGGEDIARRMLELSRPEQEQQGELALPIEILLHVLHDEPLEALSGSRLRDISSMVFAAADARESSAAAGALLAGELPARSAFHVVTGAILAALDHPEDVLAIVSAADRALGIGGEDDGWQERLRAPEPTVGFLSPDAVREAIVIGAIMER